MARDERMYPNFGDGNFAFHLFRYLWALRFAYDRIVLDAGCGSGYGADLLAAVARRVVGVDHDAEVMKTRRSMRTGAISRSSSRPSQTCRSPTRALISS